jgi:proteic killer suppression protein
VQISFANRKLQRTCESSSELERRFGARMGRVLGNRLNELAAAPTMAGAMAVPHLKLHQLSADRDEQFSLTLVEPRRLILEIAHDPMPRDADGGIDLEAVTDILVIEVVDYH